MPHPPTVSPPGGGRRRHNTSTSSLDGSLSLHPDVSFKLSSSSSSSFCGNRRGMKPKNDFVSPSDSFSHQVKDVEDFIVLEDDDNCGQDNASRCTYTRNRSKRQFRLSSTFPGESSASSEPFSSSSSSSSSSFASRDIRNATPNSSSSSSSSSVSSSTDTTCSPFYPSDLFSSSSSSSSFSPSKKTSVSDDSRLSSSKQYDTRHISNSSSSASPRRGSSSPFRRSTSPFSPFKRKGKAKGTERNPEEDGISSSSCPSRTWGSRAYVPSQSWLERELGVAVWKSTGTRRGYLFNIVQMNMEVSITRDKKETLSGLHLYFVSESGVTWRTSLLHRPYFYLSVKRNSLRGETASTYLLQLQEAIKDHLERVDVQIEEAYREDLSDPAHLARLLPSWDFDSSETAESFAKKRFASAAGKEAQDRKDDAKMPSRRLFLKLSFSNVKSLVEARDELRKIVRRNREVHQRRQEEERRMGGYIGEKKKKSFYSSSSLTDGFSSSSRSALEGASRTSGKHLGGGGNEEDDEEGDVLELIDDLFEADVLYIARCCIDLKLRCGLWHDVKKSSVSMADPLEVGGEMFHRLFFPLSPIRSLLLIALA